MSPDSPAITVWRLGEQPTSWPPPGREVAGDPAILYLPIDPHSRWDDVLDDLKRVPASAFYEADAVVVRAHAEEARWLLDDREKLGRGISVRAIGRPVWLLDWDKGHRLRCIDPGRGPDTPRDLAARDLQVIAAIRTAELRMLVDRRGVLLRPHDDYHYVAPNGKHYRQFVRVGLALQSLAPLDAFSFWLLDHLRDDPVILTGSGMITLGLAAKRYAAAMGIGEPANIGSVEHLLHHDETNQRTYLRARLGAVRERHRCSTDPTLLVLLSVSDSGRARERLFTLGSELGLETRAVSLFVAPGYETGDSEVALAEVDSPLDSVPGDDCEYCKNQSVGVRIDRSTLLMEVLAKSEAQILGASDTQEAKEFCKRYGDADALRLHWTEQDGRHHGIDVDVNRLIDHPAFQERLANELEDWQGEVDLVLGPQHEAARRLVASVRSILRLDEKAALCIDEHQLPQYDAEDPVARRLHEARRFLIVDDATMTGRRMSRYREYLSRRGLFRDGDDAKVIFGVARPASPHVLSGLRDSTFSPEAPEANCRWVEHLTLPYWNEQTCPWCKERALLEELDRETRGTPEVAARLEALSDLDAGLAADAVFLEDPELPLTLGKGSFLEKRTPLETMVCIASGIQTMRDGKRLRREQRFPVAHALDIDASVEGLVDVERSNIRWFEGILSGAMLRACGPADINNPITTPPLREAVTSVLRTDPPDSRRHEYALAMALQKLPRVGMGDSGPPADPLLEALTRVERPPPVSP